MSLISDSLLRELFRHLRAWLSNLQRAVVIAARHTRVYLRKLSVDGSQDHGEEVKLAGMWTQLSFRLGDLHLTRLAKRCDINGRYWADPEQFDAEFLRKADVGLQRMEQLARQMIAEIGAGK